MKKILLFLSCLLVFSFFSCENDDNATTPGNEDPQVNLNFEENFGNTITARFFGNVVDEQNEPIQGATIRIGNTVATTDLFGIFSISDANAFEKFAYVTAEKDGYIIGSRTLAPSASGVNRVEIMLLKEDVIATINTGQEATVNLPNGTEVTFDGNFTKLDGSSYSGDVNVILKHLSPDDENMEAMMPGMLFAQDASGDAVALETYGMLAVELRNGSGEELQLAEGSMSQISMPLAANTVNPPATIPLWHFDETEGYWIEEGEATLQGNMYVGDVSHFTFWNYDYPYPSIYLCIQLEDENGNSMPYTPLDLYSTLLNSTGTYGYTNGNGLECGLVPSGEELTVIVPGVSCSGEPFTTTIGPFTSDTTTTVTVIANNQSTSILTGTFVTCDGNNVTDGYIQLFINGTSEVIPVTDGTINYTVSYCETLDYSIKGIDVANNQVTSITTGTLDGSATVDLGTLSSCTGFVDSDDDGIFDSFEDLNGDNDLTNDDTDQDGTPNYLDADDDGDGIDTADEDYDGDNDPTNEDSDGDQIPDYLDAQDAMAFVAEVPNVGCNDPLEFDLDFITSEFGNTLHTYVYYETQADADAGTNPVSSPFTILSTDFINNPNSNILFVKATNIISGQSAIGQVYLYWGDVDTDGDGLTDCEETTGVDNPYTSQVPNGTSDPNDPSDPNLPGISALTVQLSESLINVNVEVMLTSASSVDTVIDVIGIQGTATETVDYSFVDSVVTIPAGQLTTFVSITIVDDALVEENEFFTIYGTVTSGNTSNINFEAIYTILDDDTTSTYPTTGTIETCSDANTLGVFDLTSMDAYYSQGGVAGTTTISYHQTQADASAGLNALSSPFTATSDSTLFVLIVAPTGDIQISTLSCIVNTTPTAVGGLSLTLCDVNGNGFGNFDLSQLYSQIVQSQANLVVTYHETPADAENNVNPIPSLYSNITTYQQTLYYRLENPQTGCFVVVAFDLIVDPSC